VNVKKTATVTYLLIGMFTQDKSIILLRHGMKCVHDLSTFENNSCPSWELNLISSDLQAGVNPPHKKASALVDLTFLNNALLQH
jgi:hypothetical protein